ncbi:response regulator [Myxococcota bacterium]|nr:response regulator [Myxococcota bacterium]
MSDSKPFQRNGTAVPNALRWFIPDAIFSMGPEVVLRSTVLLLLCPILFVAALVPAVAQLLSETLSPVDRVVCIVASAVFFAGPFVLRLTASPDLTAALLLGGTLSIAAIPAYFQQGLASVLSVWFAVAPMIGIYLLGVMRGMVLCLLGIAIYTFFFVVGDQSAPFPSEYFREETPAFRYLNLLMALFVTSSFGIFHEYSVRRSERAREELESRMRHIQKLETTGLMAGGIAHDFNNILVSILGNASLLLDEEQDDDRRRLLEPIQTAALKARDLVDHMLAYAGQGSSQIGPVSLNDAVDDVKVLIGPGVSGATRVHYELAPDLPKINADAGQLEQVVMNLVNNALDASLPGSDRVVVRTGSAHFSASQLEWSLLGRSLPAGHFAYLEVEDRGVGIERDEVETIFDPFYSTKERGRGLGLSSVFGIVRSHGGAIQVTSEPGRGSVFRVLFSTAVEGTTPGEAKTVETATAPVVGVQGGRILLVDDEANVREFAGLVLRKAGFEVETAHDGESAIRRFDETEDGFDLVILDRIMPGVDGPAVLDHLRGRGSRVPVILSSGLGGDETVPAGVDGDLHRVLHKPYTQRELLGVVRELLSN